MFAEHALGTELAMDTAQISQLISLTVTNTSDRAITFNAVIVGTIAG
jgi:hypothetical protein